MNSKKIASSTFFWIILSAVLALALVFKSRTLNSVIPFLGIFICPLVMFFGMKGMHNGDNKSNEKHHD